MSRPLVVFTDDTVHPAAAERLAPSCELRVLTGIYPKEQTLAEACAGATAILARMGVVTRRVIEAAPKLKIIARHGIGVDAVDLDAANEHGIIVTTTGSVNAGAVAEYAFALLLGIVRKVRQADGGMRNGEWNRNPLVGMELAGKTLGIIGLGAIGKHMARQALGFRMRVLAQDPVAKPPGDLDIEMTTREDLLARSDVVSLHMRLSKDTWHTIDGKNLALMKPTAIFVNVSRGELVDEKELITALQTGRIAGAALDVYEHEPLATDSPLRQLPNVLLSPHVAGQTRESMRLVALAAADAILDVIAGRTPAHVYNPEASSRPTQTAG
jgi:D-3-phosphoglycerate dehydrogenase